MSKLGAFLLLFVVCPCADGIMERFGFVGLLAAVGVCGLMVWGGEWREYIGV